ncbi:MAG: glycosyltransferase [Blastocatellia bacterium]
MSVRRIKVMHVLNSLGVGGTERMLINLIQRMDTARFEHLICCVSERGAAASQLRPDIRLIDMGKGSARDLLMPRRIARMIAAEKPDIVHTRSWAGVDGVIARQLSGLPGRQPRLVHSEHGRNLPYIHFEPWKSRVVRRVVYHLADVVFTVSAELREHYCRETGFPPARVRVLSNGIDVTRFDQPEDDGAARRELGFGPDDFVVCMVSRLSPTKDFPTLARAFAALRREQERPARLLIVGEGSERAWLEGFASEQGLRNDIRLTGERNDIPRLLRAVDAFVLSSHSEGLSGAILEAMCARLPVVASAVGANPELVAEGQTGFLFPAGDQVTLRARLTWLRDNPEPARQMGLAGRRRAEETYGMENMVRQYSDMYAELAGR